MQQQSWSRREVLCRSVAWGAGSAIGFPRRAAALPLPPTLRILCSGPAGSIPDIVARRYAERLTGRLAGQVLVDNRAGAAGRIAVQALRQAAPDGATLLLAQGAVATVYPSLYARLDYDPAVDLKPVSVAAEATLALAVGPAVPASVASLREFIAWTARNPALANFGSPGTGTLPHLLGAAFFREARVDWQHVVYAGGPPAMVDLLGGRIAALILPEGLLRQHHAAGTLRVLATSGAGRSTYLPEVPSFAEQGFAGLVMREWFAFFMPGASPGPLAESVAQALREAAASPALVAALGESGMLASAGTPAALAELIAAEQKYWQGVVRATGIRAES